MSKPTVEPRKKPRRAITPAMRERLRNALIIGTAGGYLGSMVLTAGKSGYRGARIGAGVGALIGGTNKGKRSSTVDTIGTGGDWKFSAYIEDMRFKDLPKEVQTDITRFVDAKAATPLVHYGMTTAELVGKADPENLKAARKALGTLRPSRAMTEVQERTQKGTKYVLLMNDRIVDGHHFLAKAERAGLTSSLNVLDLTPARLALTAFSRSESRAREGVGIAKDVAVIGGAAAAGVGVNRAAKTLREKLNDPEVRKLLKHGQVAVRTWHRAGKTTGTTAKTVGEAAAPMAAVSRGLKGAGRGIAKIGKAARSMLHLAHDGRPVRGFAKPNLDAGWRKKAYAAEGGRLAGNVAGAVAGAKLAPKITKHPLGRLGVAAAGAIGGGLAGKHLVKRGFPKAAKGDEKIESAKDSFVESNRASYVQSGVVGSIAGMGAGALLKGRGGVTRKAAALGAAAGLGLRGSMQRRINRREDEVLATARDKRATPEQKVKRALPQLLKRAGENMAIPVAGVAAVIGGRALKRNLPAMANSSLGRKLRAAILKKQRAARPEARARRVSGAPKGKGPIIDAATGRPDLNLKHDARPLTAFDEPRKNRLGKARDAALLAGGVAATGAGVYAATKAGGLVKQGKALIDEGRTIAGNVRNSTRISNDVGRAYGYLTQEVRRPKRLMTKTRSGFRAGMNDAARKPAPPWAKKVVRVMKKTKLLEAPQTRVTQFGIAASLIGSAASMPLAAKLRRSVFRGARLRGLGPRTARIAAGVPEAAVPLAGGVAGDAVAKKLQRKKPLEKRELRARLRKVIQFGGREQLADLDKGGYLDPLDVFIGRKKGYGKQQVKDYHRLRRYIDDVKGGRRKAAPGSTAKAAQAMKDIAAASSSADHGQVIRSVMRKADTAQRWSGRAGGLVKDSVSHLRGQPREKDNWGRPKKREWEKPWFQRKKGQLVAAAAIGGGALLLRKNPALRQGLDRAKAAVQNRANSVVKNAFPNAAPPSAAAPKVTRSSPSQVIAGLQKRPGVNPAAPTGKAKGKPIKKFTKFKARLRALTQFDDPFDAGWDLRDARGRSARVFAPGSRARDRRPKKWHERLENERKLWGAGVGLAALAGGGVAAKVLKARPNLIGAKPIKGLRGTVRRSVKQPVARAPGTGDQPPLRVMPRPQRRTA